MFSDFIKRNSTVFEKDISEWAFSEEEEGEESSELSKIRAAQNFLNECGCASFLCSLIENDLSLSLKMGT
jgi:carbamate kinase